MKPAFILGAIGSIAIPVHALVAVRQEPDPNAPVGTVVGYTLSDCLSSRGLEVGDKIVQDNLVANECRDTRIFLSFIATVKSGPIDDYDCGFEAYFDAGCVGPKIANSQAANGYAKCYNTILSPESVSLKVGTKSYKWACVKKTCV